MLFKAPTTSRTAYVHCASIPMLATGNSAIAAVERLKQRGANKLRFLCLRAAPKASKKFREAHPDVPVFAAAIDSHLNDIGYIVPGLGDAGDRMFGTKSAPSGPPGPRLSPGSATRERRDAFLHVFPRTLPGVISRVSAAHPEKWRREGRDLSAECTRASLTDLSNSNSLRRKPPRKSFSQSYTPGSVRNTHVIHLAGGQLITVQRRRIGRR